MYRDFMHGLTESEAVAFRRVAQVLLEEDNKRPVRAVQAAGGRLEDPAEIGRAHV